MLLIHLLYFLLDFKFVTTNGERPTPENSKAIEPGDEEGRGSLVYFNQATMYACSETDSKTLQAAKEKGLSGTTDYGPSVQAAFSKIALTPINPPHI